MNFLKYILLAILALILVFGMRGDLAYIFPTSWNYIRYIQYYLGSIYNIFYGYRLPVNPDPTHQFNNSNRLGNSIIIISLMSFTMLVLFALFTYKLI